MFAGKARGVRPHRKDNLIYIFDIDGTLADLSHRLHFITGEKKDWTGFYAAADGDKLIPEVVQIAIALRHNNHKIIYSTGRSEEIRDLTEEWLEYAGLPCGEVFMRREGDHREDSVVKAELLDAIIEMFGSVAGVFEDRQQVVDMYRARGPRVFQVAPGNF